MKTKYCCKLIIIVVKNSLHCRCFEKLVLLLYFEIWRSTKRIQFERLFPDYPNSLQFAGFPKHILWTNQVCFFTRYFFTVTFAARNNPHDLERVLSWKFSVNFWTGIVGDYIVGSYLFRIINCLWSTHYRIP